MELLQSDQVFAQISMPYFQKLWDQLYEEYPWKTGFQNRLFVQTWYEHYRSVFQPLIIFSEDISAPALLPLAICDRKLFVAGAHQAEYQAWLARRADANFLPEAIRLTTNKLGLCTLTFKYLPPKFPIEILQSSSIHIQSFPRPLMRVNPPDNIIQSLKKRVTRVELIAWRDRESWFWIILSTKKCFWNSSTN